MRKYDTGFAFQVIVMFQTGVSEHRICVFGFLWILQLWIGTSCARVLLDTFNLVEYIGVQCCYILRSENSSGLPVWREGETKSLIDRVSGPSQKPKDRGSQFQESGRLLSGCQSNSDP